MSEQPNTLTMQEYNGKICVKNIRKKIRVGSEKESVSETNYEVGFGMFYEKDTVQQLEF
jgi:hypothetical protein